MNTLHRTEVEARAIATHDRLVVVVRITLRLADVVSIGPNLRVSDVFSLAFNRHANLGILKLLEQRLNLRGAIVSAGRNLLHQAELLKRNRQAAQGRIDALRSIEHTVDGAFRTGGLVLAASIFRHIRRDDLGFELYHVDTLGRLNLLGLADKDDIEGGGNETDDDFLSTNRHCIIELVVVVL